ncbi:hypothetical protein [Streptomyces hainanensis]|uniref:DUF4388 domain-containing protein n=1 Tax=Streptomyces hainanensis TaxID=402648 RepID=A0A4R4T0U7_9ACTN|nr:hypothetical protein [Streptomyces hainanensis]TDC68452.1 hypothetical protein E1283_27380 [Streptomyces hainanensis]
MTDAGPPPPSRNVSGLLRRLRDREFTGAVVVSGAPGGTIHLRAGRVTAIDTPGSPPVESLLLKSGRIDEEAWSAARATAGPSDPVGVTLVEHGLVGAVELEVVCAAAVHDAAFALALTAPGGWDVAESALPPQVTAGPGVEPQALSQETGRRLTLLPRLWGSATELVRGRVHAPALASDPLPPRYREILRFVNGRRTVRDLAFALGRGVFPVLLDLSRMRARHLVTVELPTSTSPLGDGLGPRTDVGGAPPPPLPLGFPLPRRTPGGHLPDRGR